MKIICLALLCCTGLSLFAQPLLPKNDYWTKLDNGLEVVVIENNKVPLATVEIAVKNGAYTEGPEYSGLSHMYQHMFFKANKDYPDQEKILKKTRELGAFFNGNTTEERVNYYITFDKDSLQEGLKFMNSALRYPIYREEDMRNERPVVDGEFQRQESDPWFIIYHECQKKLWGDEFTRKNVMGDHHVINTATPEKMSIIKDKYYYPNNSILVISGDVNHDNVFALIKNIYGDWPKSSFDPFVKYPIPEFKPLLSTEYVVKESSIAKTPYIQMFWQGPDYRHDSAGTLAAQVFCTILGLNASRWQQALVDKGLVTYADIRYQTEKYVGPINLFMTPNPNKIKECYAETMNQIHSWSSDDYFTEEQLSDAKQKLRRDRIRAQEKPSSLTSQLTYWWASTSLDFSTDYDKNLQQVSKEDIKKFVAAYLKNKPYVAGLIINPELNKVAKANDFFKPNL